MKIVYIYPALTTIGGADRIITDKANYFADFYDYDVHIITAHQNGVSPFFKLSNKVTHIDLDVNFLIQYKYSFFKRAIVYYYLLRKYKKRLSEKLMKIRADYVITTISRDIDFIHTIPDGSIKIAEAHAPKKYLRNLHMMQEKSLPYRIAGKIWEKKLERAAVKFDAFVVLTKQDAESWKNVRSCEVIPNPLPFLPTEQSSCEARKVISVGRLYHEKGYERLIEIWSKVALNYPGWCLEIYGNGELEGKLRSMINDKKLDNSIFIKSPVKDIEEKYLNSSVYVMTSHFEGFGMVLLEAMACGLPVIAFDCPVGPANIINDSIDGFLIDNGDIDSYSDKLRMLLQSHELRVNMGTEARENVKRFSKEKIMGDWQNLFTKLKSK